jgi:hypothetical protein
MAHHLIPLVGLAGYAGSGKDRAADCLLSLGYTKRGFADALKDLAGRIGWDGHKDDTGRRLLQELGVGCRDVLGSDVWVDALFANLTGPTVITDVRFPNEVAAIANHGGVVVRIVRPGVDPARGHISETALDDLDLPVIVNDHSVEQLHSRLMRFVVAQPLTP